MTKTDALLGMILSLTFFVVVSYAIIDSRLTKLEQSFYCDMDFCGETLQELKIIRELEEK